MLNRTFKTLHKTVRGASHVAKGIVCQDCSKSYTDYGDPGTGEWYFCAVADGHGDTTCMRSDVGSKFATEAVFEAMEELAHLILRGEYKTRPWESEKPWGRESREYGEPLSLDYIELWGRWSQFADPYTFADDLAGGATNEDFTPTSVVMSALACRIVSKWYEKVRQHILEHEFSNDDLAKMGYSHMPSEDENDFPSLRHAYGTTIICCMVIKNHALLLHQGDGRCDVFFADGTVEQPIPWDVRCYDVYTTSLCDDDSAQKMRYCIIDLEKKPVAAIYMGSDGIEDCFPEDDEGRYCFYRELSGTLVEYSNRSEGELYDFLGRKLSDMSTRGSADDMSVAGIVDIERLHNLSKQFDAAISNYNAEVEKSKIIAKLESMKPKHDMLEQECSRLRLELDEKNRELEDKRQVKNGREKQLEELNNRDLNYKNDVDAYAKEIQELEDKKKRYEDTIDEIVSSSRYERMYIDEFLALEESLLKIMNELNRIDRDIKKNKNEMEKMRRVLGKSHRSLKTAQERYKRASEVVEDGEKECELAITAYNEALKDYESYDQEYAFWLTRLDELKSGVTADNSFAPSSTLHEVSDDYMKIKSSVSPMRVRK